MFLQGILRKMGEKGTKHVQTKKRRYNRKKKIHETFIEKANCREMEENEERLAVREFAFFGVKRFFV
jgi:hypothetical protein